MENSKADSCKQNKLEEWERQFGESSFKQVLEMKKNRVHLGKCRCSLIQQMIVVLATYTRSWDNTVVIKIDSCLVRLQCMVVRGGGGEYVRG